MLVSGLALLVISPVILIAYILVKLDSPGPFLFTQQRLGRNGVSFEVLKIRTMTNKKRVADREILKGDAEVTRVGAVLRRLKIDELLQLANILRGDMSLVGPRPALVTQLQEFDENGKARLLVRPGLTGLAQVNGNIFLSWPERWVYDRMYVEKLSFLLDVQIILKTVLIVILGEEKFLKKPYA